MFPGLALYYAGPAQPLTRAGEELDHLDHDLPVIYLSDVCFIAKISYFAYAQERGTR